MKAKLEIKIINAHLNKEISSLEKEISLTVLTKYLQAFEKSDVTHNEIFNCVLVIARKFIREFEINSNMDGKNEN